MNKEPLKYISTRGHQDKLDFKDVIFEGLAPDGGLYIPEKWPTLNDSILKTFPNKTYQEIAYDVISMFVDDSISNSDLRSIINSSYKNFRSQDITPVTKINEKEYLLELFHGPTYAFKDIAMQFISQLMRFYLLKTNKSINILAATSGDTGAAAIEGFKHIQSSKIFILHPYKKISEIQRKFMTTIDSENVFNIAIKGNFDECQIIIKKIFSDTKFKKSKNLTAVNSINWARIMCQIVYYFYAASRLDNIKNNILYSVPTGNFGDIFAGYIASKMGLKIGTLNIATNENDILTRTLTTGIHKTKDVIFTTSPSIDIQVSSNFERLLFDITKNPDFINSIMNDLNKNGEYTLPTEIISDISKSFSSYTVNQAEVESIIKKLFDKQKIIIDPHTAVGLASSRKCDDKHDLNVTLSTAHPVKFKDTISNIIDYNDKEIPKSVRSLFNKEEKLHIMENDIVMVQKFIEKNTI